MSVVNTDGCDYSVASSLVVSANVTGVRNINETNKNVYVYVNNGKMLNIAFVGYNGEVATIQAFNLLGQEILNVKHNTGTKFVKEIETVEAAYVVVGVTIDGKTVSKKVLITKE